MTYPIGVGRCLPEALTGLHTQSFLARAQDRVISNYLRFREKKKIKTKRLSHTLAWPGNLYRRNPEFLKGDSPVQVEEGRAAGTVSPKKSKKEGILTYLSRKGRKAARSNQWNESWINEWILMRKTSVHLCSSWKEHFIHFPFSKHGLCTVPKYRAAVDYTPRLRASRNLPRCMANSDTCRQ